MAKKGNTTVKTKVTPTTKKSKAVKPKLGRGTGGLFTAKIIADVKSKEQKTEKKK